MNKTLMETISDKIKVRMLSLMEEKPPEDRKPSNFGLTVAWFGFNFVYLFLDIGTSVMVGALTNPFYGVMTFIAGIVPFMLNEVLFVRPYNNQFQQRLAIGGAVISILSTISLALLVGSINAIKFFQLTGLPLWVTDTLGWTVIIGSVLAVGIHGVVWIVYFFNDEGISARQTRTANIANQAKRREKMVFAKQDVNDILEMAKDVDEYEKSNALEALALALGKYGLSIDASGAKSNGNRQYNQSVNPSPPPRKDE